MQAPVYHSQNIRAWEQRWFSQQNSSLGLMQQMAWSVATWLDRYNDKNSLSIQKIAVWCGVGNNAGDGYYTAAYLQQLGYDVQIFAAQMAQETAALSFAKQQQVHINSSFDVNIEFDCHIDALFGIGLNRELDQEWQSIIHQYNAVSGFKVAIDLPSGLHADTGQTLPVATKVNVTLSALGLKVGQLTGQAKEYVGQLEVFSLIPTDEALIPTAYLTSTNLHLPKRKAYGHKGSYGHVLVVGGHANMGGAVIMAAEAASHSGAGKVTVVCDPIHHGAILARSPNLMVKDINHLAHEDLCTLVDTAHAVCFGMGLGRDQWSEHVFNIWFDVLEQSKTQVVLDADALWFLAGKNAQLTDHTFLTPHSAEAARLLDLSVAQVEQDRVKAIYELQKKYQGQWVLKGSGSLVLVSDKLSICATGNAGMATGGMGDVLSGLIAGLKAQFHNEIELSDIVTLHGSAGDLLAKKGQKGLLAQHMPEAIYQLVNR